MLKAIKYLKPFWLSVLAVIALVFAQVQAELALPDYMARIVTYGIQYGGITETVPRALSRETYEHMLYFMSEADRVTFENAYQYAEQNDPAYISAYPAIKNDGIYVLQESDDTLTDVVGKPFLIVSALSSNGSGDAEMLWDMLAKDPAQASAIAAKTEEQMAGYTEDNLQAAEILVTKAEYAKLGINTEKLQNDYIIHEGLLMLGIALLGSLFAIASSYLASRTATGACRNMRRDVFAKVESFSNEEFSHFSTASLITRTTNDIQQVQMVLTMMLRVVLFAPFMGFTSLFKVLRYKSLASLLGWVILFMIGLMIIILYFTMPKFRIAQKLVDKLNMVSREQLDGILVVRAFNNQAEEEKRFDEVNTDITKLNIFLNRVMAVITPIMTFIMSSLSILIIWIGASQIDAGTMLIGDMLAFLQYASHVLISFMIVAAIFIMIPRSAVSAKRVFEVLDTEPTIHDPSAPKQLPSENVPIVFDHVSFRYPHAEKDVLEDISFTANPGETVAFIGSTGSGKSTLINLVPRFFDVSEGSIRLGDTDIRDVTQKELRKKIGYVPQKGVLFSGTIRSNLLYADENANEETLQTALRVSQSEEFVNNKPAGMDEPIAQGGTNVSGGQKQRLSIARALTKQAQIYIFDDTFSALDYQTDAKLRKELNELTEQTHATVLIVAQRISTIMHADQIVVLDQGRIAGIGTHKELLNSCKVYQEIAYSQLSEEELSANLQEAVA